MRIKVNANLILQVNNPKPNITVAAVALAVEQALNRLHAIKDDELKTLIGLRVHVQSITEIEKDNDIDDAIDRLLDACDLDAVIRWARILGVEVEYPPVDDMYPDWENELRVEIGTAMNRLASE